MAKTLQTTPRAIYSRRAKLVQKGMDLPPRDSSVMFKPARQRIDIQIDNGTILVGSDAHYWPNEITTAHRAFVRLCNEIRPWSVILNGDILDGAGSVNRHSRIGWEARPTMKEEIAAVQDRVAEIEKAAKGAKLFRTHGNHDLRFDSHLSSFAADFEGIEGFALDHHLPKWKSAWSIFINGHTIVTHRMKGGIHATWTSTADAQINTVCGHLHSLRVTPRTTLGQTNGGHLYGVDTGTLADCFGPQFTYVDTQGTFRNWRSGFAALTFCDGILMPPEIAMVVEEGCVFFRGQKIEIHD